MIGCIIQARMGSTRLPGKVMMKVDDENPVLYYVISQLQNSSLLDKIVVATTDLEQDKQIEKFTLDLGIECFRGSSDDVLDRYYKCAQKFSFSTIVRITADNPLIDPTIVDETIQKFNSNQYDFVSNCVNRTFPHGTEVEVFSFDALEKSWNESTNLSDREHVTSYFYSNSNKFKNFNLEHIKNISHLSWTVDKINDLKFVQTIVSKITKRPIVLNDIVDLLSKEPELLKLNQKQVEKSVSKMMSYEKPKNT
jgi:spore coat polysaccharide biosynthesis protein SpsF